ncbi:MAG: helix-turn-helix transcriptional regulator [Kiritimatiellae bacterium]|nr:helix-turn-helix transcriptional regulator [Kiritimatiellia bacterium]
MAEWLAGVLRVWRFRVEWSYDAPAPPGWGPRERVIDTCHMVLIKSGRGEYVVQGRRVPLRRGRLVFVGPGLVHSAFADAAAGPYLLTSRFRLHRRATDEPVNRAPAPFWTTRMVPDLEKYVTLFEALNRHFTAERTPVRQAACDSVVTQIVCELALDADRPARRKDHRIDAVQRHVRRHPEQRLVVSELARMAGLSKKQFGRLFRQYTGRTPTQYHIHVRCERAKLQLADTSQSIKQIAYTLGYPNPFAFSKQFAQTVGCSPSAYRARAR